MLDQPQLCDLRIAAANLLRRFRDGEITNDEFEDAYYPLLHRAEDRALRACATVAWHSYSDWREHTLPPLSAEMRALFDRCILFLRSGLPYAWERDNFIAIAGFGWLTRIAGDVRRWLGRMPEHPRFRPGPESEADWAVWPFQSEQELRRIENQLGNS